MNIFDGIIANERNVKTYIWTIPFFMIGKRRAGGLKKPVLLGRRQGIGRLLKAAAAFNFDEHQG